MNDDATHEDGTGAMDPEQPVAWSMTFRVLADGTRELNVEGTPSVGDMIAEFSLMVENLRAQLVVDKILAAGQEAQRKPRIHRV